MVAPLLYLAVVHYQFLSLSDLKEEIIILTPVLQILQVDPLIIVSDQTSSNHVISELGNCYLAVSGHALVCLQ